MFNFIFLFLSHFVRFLCKIGLQRYQTFWEFTQAQDENDTFIRDEIEHEKTWKTRFLKFYQFSKFSDVWFNLTSCGIDLISCRLSNESLK